jgi:hypothetical protein
MDPKNRRVKIHPNEMESLLNLKFRLDYQEMVSSYTEKYQQLGWILEAVNLPEGTGQEVDAAPDPGAWGDCREEPGLSEPQFNLGVRTGQRSRLMVMEVAKRQGEFHLDRYGAWRAQCIAILESGREQHFYAWDPSSLFESGSLQATPEIRWFGEGEVVPVPPAIDPEGGETWRWLSPPWEKPLQPPGQAVSKFLQHHLTRSVQSGVTLSWQEVYCLASPYEPLLQALSASHESMQTYYHGILTAAAAAGIMTQDVLLSVLWHAPRGYARQHPAIWGYLQQLVAGVQDHASPGISPEPGQWEIILDEALSLARATSSVSTGQWADNTGPTGFLRRRPAKPSQPEAAKRTSFSCRQIKAEVTKIP